MLQTASVTSHRNRPEGMWTLLVNARLWSFCSALPSWLLSYLYSTQFEESYRTEMGKPAALPPRSTLKKKKKQNRNNIHNFFWERNGLHTTLKPSLLCDLPIVLDFLMNADGQATVPNVIHTFFGYGKT